uniref:hypothetical protein n=1 Tax=Megasphaera elsdenii TaxID=907 RepID=UPI003F7E4CA3
PPIYTFIVSLYGKPQFDLSYLYASTNIRILILEESIFSNGWLDPCSFEEEFPEVLLNIDSFLLEIS